MPMAPRPRELTALHGGAKIALVPEQELIVALDANTTTGYRWSVKMGVDGILRATGEPSYAPLMGDPRLVGAGGTTTFRFRAVAPGNTTVVFT